ncbi:tubulin monoglycylase TTLL3 [Osmerus mordax]|uniref:tubulin monoglycylase TTLL3 n=1 Tax=Osmerus mordax TaxID=8014 RepID=UPI0035100653
MQHMPSPPVEGRGRRRLLSLPVINPDRLRTAKALVEKAVKSRRVFSVQGPYPVIRAALRARGWVERRLPRLSQPAVHCHGDEDEDGDDCDDSNDDNDRGVEGEKEEDPDDMCSLLSRLVRNETSYFYWTTRRDSIDCHSLRKDQMTNHFAKAGTFTTKVGLCLNLRNLQWFDAADPDTFFPRCYRLGAEDEKHAFIEDFRRTACTSLLQYIVERSGGVLGDREDIMEEDHASGESQGLRKQYKHRETRTVGPGIIDRALNVCQEFLYSLDHSDIDVIMETPPCLSEQQWAEFMRDYYLLVHDGGLIEGAGEYVERCQAMLTTLHQFCPQLDTDGLHNIWIIKPGAKSRGRGIMCMNRLDDILRLVDSDPSLIKDSKWVVQKYLERPLLVHGTKFDLRQWFLVTDWNPLTIWFYQECYLRFSTQPYSTHTLDSSVHLCNNSIQKHFQPSQQRHPGVPGDNMWSCSEFQAFLRGQGRGAAWGTVVVPGMQQAVVHALQTAQDLVEARKGSFELYGADFMLGRDLRPWLLEINASPTMASSTAVTARLCPAVQLDTLRVVLDRRADPGAYTGGFQLIYKQAAVEVPHYVGVNLFVEGAPLRRPRPPLPRHQVNPDPPPTTQPVSNQSASELTHRTGMPSNDKPTAASGRRPSGKENHLQGTKKKQPPIESPKKECEGRTLKRLNATPTLKLSRRLAPERPLVLHTEPQKRACHVGLSQSSVGPLRLVPRTLYYSLNSPCSTSDPQLPSTLEPRTSRPLIPGPTLGPSCRAPPWGLPTLYSPTPALEVFSLRPSGRLLGRLCRPCPKLASHPVLSVRMHQFLPPFHRQGMASYKGGSATGGPESS